MEGGLGERRVELKEVEALIEMEREQQAMLIMRITQELDDQVRHLRTQIVLARSYINVARLIACLVSCLCSALCCRA